MSTVGCGARRVALALGMLATAAVTSPAQSLYYVGGLQYATGDFIFAQRTWSAYLSNGLTWSAGRLRASASVPLVMQPAGWLQYTGNGMMVPAGATTGSAGSTMGTGSGMGSRMQGGTMASGGAAFNGVGIGDPIGRIDVALTRACRSVSLVGAVKAPLADAKNGLGTGEWDVGAGLSGALSVAGTSVLADAVYWKLGNPAGASLRNAVAYALSIGRAFPRGRWSVLGTVSGASSYSKGREAPVQAGMGVGYGLASGSSVFVTAAAGLTRTAPTISTGLGWRVPLGRTRQVLELR